MSIARTILWRGGVGAVFAVVLLPVAAVIWLSFFNQEIVAFPPPGYTWHWYANAWSKPEFVRGFLTSLQVALVSAAIGVSLGTAAAYALVRGRFPGK